MDSTTTNDTTAIRGTVCALFSAVAFGLLIPFTKLSLNGLEPIQLAALLGLGAGIGTACLLAVRAATGRKAGGASIAREDLPRLAVIVALNAVAVACLCFGVSATLAENASVLMGFEIAAATVFAWAFLGRHVCYKACAAVGLIVVSTVLLFWDAFDAVTFVPESLFIVVACVLRGFERCIKKTFVGKDPLQITCVRSLGAGLILGVVAYAANGIPTAGPALTGGALLLGFATFGIGATLHLAAQRDIGPARSEGYFAFAPFIGLLISWGYFGFSLEPLFFGALAFMALGVWLAMDDRVFHEDALVAADNERVALYMSEAGAFEFDRLHRPAS